MAIKGQIALPTDFKQRHSSGSNKSLLSSTVPHVSSFGKKLRQSRASHGPGCTKSCRGLGTLYAAWTGAILPHAPLVYSHPRGESCCGRSRRAWSSPCPPPAHCHPDEKLPLPSLRCLRRRAGCKKPLWDVLDGPYSPQGTLQKAGAVRPDSQRGCLSVPPPRVPAVCTVLPCSRVVVNEVKQQVNKQANEVRSQVLPAALARLRTMRSFAASKKKNKKPTKLPSCSWKVSEAITLMTMNGAKNNLG